MRKILSSVILTISSFLFVFFFLEILLRSGYFERYSTIWVSPDSLKIRHSIENELYKRAKNNEKDGYFFFNDDIPKKQKSTKKRIIVLGDSFVFGEGLPYKQSWPHKLNKLINVEHSVETLAWGVGGWSSKDQFFFFKKHGLQYKPDFLIIGFVDNDPEELMKFPKCKSKAFQISNFWKRASKFYTVLFIDQHLVRLNYIANCEDHIKRLYTKENLELYEKLIIDFKIYLEKNKVPFVFILTPSNYDKHFKFVNSKIIPILEKHKIDFINTYPEVVRKTSHIPYRLLWANPGDRHPGEQMTEIFAKEAFKFLKKNNFFSTQ